MTTNDSNESIGRTEQLFDRVDAVPLDPDGTLADYDPWDELLVTAEGDRR